MTLHINPASSASLPPPDPALPAFDFKLCQAHGCDAHLLSVREGLARARASLWWSRTPQMANARAGLFGHFAAVDPVSADEVLHAACDTLKNAGCNIAIGPMDGTTWRRYRLLTERGVEPPFFLEPDNPDDWPGYLESAGFKPLAVYFSALCDDLRIEDPRIPRALDRIKSSGVIIRPLDPRNFIEELRKIYKVSLVSFAPNFLYTPISEEEFLAQYEPIRAYVRPELVTLAENVGEIVGFSFAIPDLAQARRGHAIDTVILKTLAVLPGRSHAGLGSVLLALCHREARALGYRRVIHALMHQSNNSLNISAHYARPFRRYMLFSKQL